MLGERQRRWANIETALGKCPVFVRYSLLPTAMQGQKIVTAYF